jgi:hypothetical protein
VARRRQPQQCRGRRRTRVAQAAQRLHAARRSPACVYVRARSAAARQKREGGGASRESELLSCRGRRPRRGAMRVTANVKSTVPYPQACDSCRRPAREALRRGSGPRGDSGLCTSHSSNRPRARIAAANACAPTSRVSHHHHHHHPGWPVWLAEKESGAPVARLLQPQLPAPAAGAF